MMFWTIPARLEDVLDLLARCRDALHETDLDDEIRHDVQLVLEELMVNIVMHGQPDCRPGNIRIRIQHDEHGVTVELSDDGVPFDPLQSAPFKPLHAPVDPDRIGGLGLHLVRHLASDIKYHHDTEGNHLHLRFDHSTATESQS